MGKDSELRALLEQIRDLAKHINSPTLLDISGQALAHLQPAPAADVGEAADFIEQVHIALEGRKIRDFDTNWRMAEEILPQSFAFDRKKDEAELTCHYRKIHLSDILAAARKLVKAALQPQAGEVNIENAAKALAPEAWRVKGKRIIDDTDAHIMRDRSVSRAKICAEAWGLKPTLPTTGDAGQEEGEYGA